MSRPWTLERIYARCTCEPGDPCRLWQGMAPGGYPRLNVTDPSYPHGQKQLNVRRLVYRLAKGREAPAGRTHVLVPACGNTLCVSELCLQLQPRAKLIQALADGGTFRTVTRRAAIAAGKRRGSRVDDAAVAELRASATITAEQAQRLGISRGYAYAIRSGKARIDYSSPYAALQAGQCGRK